MFSQNARDEGCRRREKGTLENYFRFNERVGRIASGVAEAAAGIAQSPLLWDCASGDGMMVPLLKQSFPSECCSSFLNNHILLNFPGLDQNSQL